jgi:periplasmic divalent cation tolerance protein
MSKLDELRLVLCNCPDAISAGQIAERLVELRLAACVNVLPGVKSVYRWEGKIESAEEYALLIKTTSAVYAQLERTIIGLHPYELPEIIAMSVTHGLPDYVEWVHENTGH